MGGRDVTRTACKAGCGRHTANRGGLCTLCLLRGGRPPRPRPTPAERRADELAAYGHEVHVLWSGYQVCGGGRRLLRHGEDH